MTGAAVLQVLEGMQVLEDGQVWRGEPTPSQAPVQVLRSGAGPLDRALALGGLPVGGLTEIRAGLGHGGLGLGLLAVATLLREDTRARAAMVDGFGTLHGAAALELGVPPGRLWCVRPPAPARAMPLALRLLRSGAFKLVLVDHALAAPTPQPELQVRRLMVAAQETATTVVLLTGGWGDHLGLPLPSALRLRVARLKPGFHPAATPAGTPGDHPLEVAIEKQRGASHTPKVTLPGRLLYSPPSWDLDHAPRPGG